MKLRKIKLQHFDGWLLLWTPQRDKTGKASIQHSGQMLRPFYVFKVCHVVRVLRMTRHDRENGEVSRGAASPLAGVIQ